MTRGFGSRGRFASSHHHTISICYQPLAPIPFWEPILTASRNRDRGTNLSINTNIVGIWKTVLLAVLIGLAVIPLSLCMEAVSLGCAHTCCTGADRSRPLQRAFRRSRMLIKSAASIALATLAEAMGLVAAFVAGFTLAPSPNQAVPLRI